MGVGNHYNMAGWFGKGFGEVSQNPRFSDDERKQPRNFDLKCLKIEDVLAKDYIDIETLEGILKTKPACKLYTSNSIISKESEDLLKVDDIEALSNSINYLSQGNEVS